MLSKFRLNVTAVTAVAALAMTSGHALAQKNTTPARAIPKSRSATSCPIAACLRLRRDRQDRRSLFQDDQRSGGINGRKINFITYDDAYSPPKAVEQARKLVESDEVLLVFGPLGTPSNSAIQNI
jgi:branched-chain amino acid transport system substrate-binding protein